MGVYERVERDFRIALKSLLEPCMDEVAGVQELRKLAKVGHDIAESVLLERPIGLEQQEPGR
jgi:hypothetical protein